MSGHGEHKPVSTGVAPYPAWKDTPHAVPYRLETAALSVRRGTTLALDAVSLAMTAGELLCVVGPSGAGKSTLIEAVLGTIPVANGTIRINGCDVTELPPQKRNLAVLFQEHSLLAHQTVFDNAGLSLRLRGVKRTEVQAIVSSILQRLGIEHLSQRYPHQLSGGERQRAALARVLSHRPSVLLLDEPFTFLDRPLRRRLLGLLRQLRREENLSVLYVTHDQEEALSLATRLIVLDKGRVVETGNPQQVYWYPRTPFACEFLGEVNYLCAEIRACMEDGVRLSIVGHEILIPLENSKGLYPDAGQVVLAIRPEVVDLAPPDGDTVHPTRLLLRASVEGAVFAGRDYEVCCRIQDGLTIMSRVPALIRQDFLQAGASVRVVIDFEKPFLLYPRNRQ